MSADSKARGDDEGGDEAELELDGDDDGGAVSGVLAQRLEELRDARWLHPVVRGALARMTGAAPEVLDCRIEYCKIKPNRDINVAMLVRTAVPGGEPSAQRLSCTLFPSAAVCNTKYAQDDGENPLSEATRRRMQAAGFRESVVVLDEPPMIVRAFPVDPALPGLARATDLAEMQQLFARGSSGAAPGTLPRVRCEVLHYKPRRSCAILYLLDEPTNGHGPAPRRVYGKLSRDDRGLRYHRNLRAAFEAAEASRGLWRAARPVEYIAPWRLLLQEAVPGRDFRVVFGELTPDDITPAQRARVEKLLSDIARAVHALQRAPIVEGPVMTFAHLFDSQERNLRYMQGSEPGLAAELAAVRAETARLEPRTRANPLVLSHGDFAHGNVLIETAGGEDRVGIIDFDKAGAAEPAYDVAYFLTHMWSFGIRHARRMPHVVELSRHFREAYLALAPEVSSERLALYEALDFSAYVLRNFRKQSHQAQWLPWARAQVAAARERLAVAGGVRG